MEVESIDEVGAMNCAVLDLAREDEETMRKTAAMADHIPFDGPCSMDPPLLGRVSLPVLQQIESDLEQAKESLERKPIQLPNLAWEAVKAGLNQEKVVNDKINGYVQEAEKIQKDIDLLLDVSAELTAHKDNQEMPEKMKTLLAELKERGIDLWKGEGPLTKDKISELKSLSSAQVDKLRSNLQIIFTTKIQVLIQTIGSILDIVKDIIRNQNRFIQATLRLPGH